MNRDRKTMTAGERHMDDIGSPLRPVETIRYTRPALRRNEKLPDGTKAKRHPLYRLGR